MYGRSQGSLVSLMGQNQLGSALKYQPLKLKKTMKVRTDQQDNSFLGIEKATGIEALPSNEIRTGILTGLVNHCTFLIVVAMYNEEPKEVVNTLTGIIQNLKVFREHGIDPQRIGCIVICDGIIPFLKTVNKEIEDESGTKSRPNASFFSDFFSLEQILQYNHAENPAALGVKYKNELATETDKEPEVAHCFEQQVALTEDGERLNLVWAVKQENLRKLNTHLWFFGGFCEYIQPEYVMLLDVGTMPHPDSLFKLYECMVKEPNVAGCCGEIVPMNPKFSSMIEGAQVVEYKYAHIFDKALECVIGYITVLPGAFSAYRWEALKGDPLWKDYFKSLCHPELMNCYYSNIFLAEDRVLCLALVSTKKKQYILKYVRSSVAETDVPEDFFKLLAQRRRWINGSWFALIETLKNRKRINESGHSCCRKFWLWFLMIYYTLNVFFSWFMVGGFFLAIAIMTRKFTVYIADTTSLTDNFMYSVYSAFVLLNLLLIIATFFLSMGVKPSFVETQYRWISRMFAFFMVFVVALTIIFGLLDEFSQSWAPWLVVATIASFVVTPIMYGVAHKMLPFYPAFVLMTPSYVNIFVTYAMCNIHDCSWGNRPDTLKKNEIEKEGEFKSFRTKWVVVWVLSNAAFAYFLNIVDKSSGKESGSSAYGLSSYIYIYAITIYAILLLVIRFMFSMIFLIQSSCFTPKLDKNELPMPQYTGRVLLVRLPQSGQDQTAASLNEAPPAPDQRRENAEESLERQQSDSENQQDVRADVESVEHSEEADERSRLTH